MATNTKANYYITNIMKKVYLLILIPTQSDKVNTKMVN